MKAMRCLSATVAACLLGFSLYPAKAVAQCPGLCGDVNGSATISSSDIIAIGDFLYHDGPLPTGHDCADVDGYDLITFRDIQLLVNYVFLGSTPPACTTIHAQIVPTPSSAYRMEHTSVVPASAADVAVQIRLVSTGNLVQAASLALQFSVEGVVPTLDSVRVASDYGPEWGRVEPTGAQPGTLAAALINPQGGLSSTADLVTAFFHVTPSPVPRMISVEHVELPPAMEDLNGVPRNVNYTMLLDWGGQAWFPATPICPISHTGDVNMDLALTSSDLIYIVNYVFKSGFAPFPCPASADVNCSGAVNSSDIIRVVNHVFKGGPAPCDVCTLIPGTWSCESP